VTPPVPVPRYGQSALADLTPSLLAGLGAPGFHDVLGVGRMRSVCLFLVDGLGWNLLRAHASDAPYLAGLAARGRPLTAGFPATTAASIASVGTGLPPGEHGFVGYLMGLPGQERPLNTLHWRWQGTSGADLLHELPPERLQPAPTAFELAARAGIPVSVVAPPFHEGSGLTRAVLRGGGFRPALTPGDLVGEAAEAAREHGGLVYVYTGDLDTAGHVRGPGSAAWRAQLRLVDSLAASLADELPGGCTLTVSADHGMVPSPPESRLDLEGEPAVLDAVRFLGGEARARHVYAEPGREREVLARWRERLGDSFWVLGRDDAVAAGWFGHRVLDAVRARIGDVVAAAHGELSLVVPSAEPLESRLLGQHGSMTADEQLVPLLVHRPQGRSRGTA
jgi:hypothetical protein